MCLCIHIHFNCCALFLVLFHIIIVLEIAEKKPQPFVLLMVLPVVQVLSLPNTSQHGSPSAVQNAANRLMQVIQESATYNWTSGGESEVNRSFGGYNSVVIHSSAVSLLRV